ncbi:FlgB family protein [Halovulum sp. GXIMD14794]
MNLNLNLLSLARGLADHSAARQSVIARNVANADTPGYRAQDIASFDEAMGEQQLGLRATRAGHVAEDGAAARYRVEANTAFGAESPNGNDVSIEDQMMRGVAAQQSHELAMGVMRKSYDILSMSIGRR